MKLLIIVSLLALGSTSVFSAKKNNCRKLDEGTNLCAPSSKWKYVTETGSPIKDGHVWLHEKRDGKKINSFMATKIKDSSFVDFRDFVAFSKSVFEKKKFKVKKHKSSNDKITVFYIETPGGEMGFYQGYAQIQDRRWSFSCMGPHKKVIGKDCPAFMVSASKGAK